MPSSWSNARGALPADGQEEPARALHRQLKALSWRHIDGHSQTVHGHGRIERRSIKVVTIAEGILFPHAAQASWITRKTRPRSGGRWKTVTVYAVTSLAAHQARPAELAAFIRSHWQIEALHYIRDVTYREDHSQIGTGSGPAVMAALRNLAIGILKFCGMVIMQSWPVANSHTCAGVPLGCIAGTGRRAEPSGFRTGDNTLRRGGCGR
jgi:hypothetical protein